MDLAAACEVSVSHFARSFKATFGIPCHQWLTQRRIERARGLLASSETAMVDIANQCGFADQAAFSRAFHRVVGLSPGEWRREHGLGPDGIGNRRDRAR
jgi:AraC-like DNA-binding protein